MLQLARLGMTKAQRVRTRHRRAKSMMYPRGIERSYARYITGTVERTSKSAIESLRPILIKYSPHLDSLDIELESVIDRLYQELTMLYGTTLSLSGSLVRTLEQFAEQVLGKNAAFMDAEIRIMAGRPLALDYSWWPEVKSLWEQENYRLITGLNTEYIKKLNGLVINGAQNDIPFEQLVNDIQILSENMSGARARLIARDQIGKLQGLISKYQQTSIGMTTYFWLNQGDLKVRGRPGGVYPQAEDHWEIGGMLCAWNNSTVYSDDIGVTWKPRPASWVQMHPGMAIQDRCIAAAAWAPYLYTIDKEHV